MGEDVWVNVRRRWLAAVLMLAVLGPCVLPASAEGGRPLEEPGTAHAREVGVSMIRPNIGLAQKPPSVSSQGQWYWITPPTGGKRLEALAQGGDTLVAVLNPGGTKVITPGRSTTIISHDGREWSAGEITAGGIYSHLAYGNGLFVAVGRGVSGARGGTIATSSDGVRWAENATTMHELTHVFYGDQMFVALGLRGTIVSSRNGADWSESTTESSGHLYAGAYGDNTFVLAGDVSIVTSPDTSHWTRHPNQDLGLPFGLRHLVFGNNSFLLLHDHALFMSAKGTYWRRNTIDLRSREVVYTQKTFFASGDDGTVLTSATGTHWEKGPKVLEVVGGVNCHTRRCIVLGKRILLIGPE